MSQSGQYEIEELGITIFPEFFQNEGVNAILDRFSAVGVTGVTISPWVAAPADRANGVRQPPDDAGEGVTRVHDRSLWGSQAPYLRWSPSYEPNRNLYRGLKYQPARPDALTETQGRTVNQIITGAHSRGIRCYFQWIPAMPPGLDDQDLPRLPNGNLPHRRVAQTGSLASPNVLEYTAAYLRDLIEAYPDIDGFRPDWPEYPPYFLESVLLDFSLHAEEAASEQGFDFNRMRQAVGDLQQGFSGLTNQTLHSFLKPQPALYYLLRKLVLSPGIADWLAFKARLSTRFLAHIRQAITAAGGRNKKLLANAFPPPLSILSGFDYEKVPADAVCMKLYTMHWPMIVRLYADHILSVNSNLDERLLVQALATVFDLVDEPEAIELETFKYPAPDQKHPVGAEAQQRKILQAKEATGGKAHLYPVVHGYGPVEDFKERLKLVLDCQPTGLWVNRYAFLSEAKLEVIKALHSFNKT